jgi:tripartite-type tricarboxylate transporter receptor subunit TctC
MMLALTSCDRAPVAAPQDSDAATYYRGRRVRIVVGVSPGGGQDLYARIMAPHLARHLAGEPSVIVENMPGAGGLIAASYLARRAPPDGLTIGLLGIQAALAQLVPQTAAFDVRDLPLIGSPADDHAVCAFARNSGFSLDVWQGGRTPRVGMTMRGSTTAAYAFLLSESLGLPLKPVLGYPGTADIKAAMASGEVDGVCLSRNSFLASFQPASDYLVVLQSGSDVAALPGVPIAERMVTSDRARSLLDILSTVGNLARYYALPPGTPEPLVTVVRTAFDRTMNDSAFRAAADAAGLEIRPQTSSIVAAKIRALLAVPPDVRSQLVAMLNPGS